jgi:RNA polymerase sigma-70 factor (ECF subfamily)
VNDADRAALEAELRELVAAGRLDAATERAIRGYGPEILGWLVATGRSESDAGDAFSRFAEELWVSLRRYDGRCSLRTWCYMLARHAAFRVREARATDRQVPLSQAPIDALVAEVRETTLIHLRTATKDRVRALRDHLDPDDQTLLVLRVDRDLGWREIAQILLGDGAAPAELDRRAVALRKRFERIKQRLRELANRPASG